MDDIFAFNIINDTYMDNGWSEVAFDFTQHFDGIYDTSQLDSYDSINLIDQNQSLLAPFDESSATNLLYRIKNPFGLYTIQNTYGYCGVPDLQPIPDFQLPEYFTYSDIQHVTNLICDTMHIEHLPISVSDSVANAAFSPGHNLTSPLDDKLYINPSYAHRCIEHLGSTDIVVSDIAHEIGHSLAYRYCGDMGTYMNEKAADFISGFINKLMGADIDTARKWFEWQYDGHGINGYPISEDRWAGEAAGYYYAGLATPEDLYNALQDPKFIEIIKSYSHDQLCGYHDLHGSEIMSDFRISSDMHSLVSDQSEDIYAENVSKEDSIEAHSDDSSMSLEENKDDYSERSLDNTNNNEMHTKGKCSTSFTGESKEDLNRQIESKKKDLEKATSNVEYWSKEIDHFNSKTTDTYRRTCNNALERESRKVRELKKDLDVLKQKVNRLR